MNLKDLLNQCFEKVKQKPQIWIGFAILLGVILLWRIPNIPVWQVSQYQINNTTEQATLKNQFRTTSIQIVATFAQLFGGFAILIGPYVAWMNVTVAQKAIEANQIIAQDNLTAAQEGQITERFTRAVDQLGAIDQLGNPAIEIRLGGIYALKRIANESDKDYWSIMEILTAYVRINSPT